MNQSDKSSDWFLTARKGAPYHRDMSEWSASLLAARARRGLTQEQAASEAGISARQWSKYENGTAKPQAITVGKLERWLAKEVS